MAEVTATKTFSFHVLTESSHHTREKEKTKAIIRARERGEKRKLQITQSPSYTRGALYSTFATVLRSVQFQTLDLEIKPFQCDSKPKSKLSGESTRVT